MALVVSLVVSVVMSRSTRTVALMEEGVMLNESYEVMNLEGESDAG